MLTRKQLWKLSMRKTQDKKYIHNSPLPLKKSVSFETMVQVTLIPSAKEYNHIRKDLWYEYSEFVEFAKSIKEEMEMQKCNIPCLP